MVTLKTTDQWGTDEITALFSLLSTNIEPVESCPVYDRLKLDMGFDPEVEVEVAWVPDDWGLEESYPRTVSEQMADLTQQMLQYGRIDDVDDYLRHQRALLWYLEQSKRGEESDGGGEEKQEQEAAPADEHAQREAGGPASEDQAAQPGEEGLRGDHEGGEGGQAEHVPG